VTFDVPSLDKAEPFDSTYMYDAQAFCKIKGADVKGGVGPFGLYVLASSDLRERTAVFFRVFKSENKHIVLMCNDPTQYVFFLLSFFFFIFSDVCIYKTNNYLCELHSKFEL
jgi:hypothetical protein